MPRAELTSAEECGEPRSNAERTAREAGYALFSAALRTPPRKPISIPSVRTGYCRIGPLHRGNARQTRMATLGRQPQPRVARSAIKNLLRETPCQTPRNSVSNVSIPHAIPSQPRHVTGSTAGAGIAGLDLARTLRVVVSSLPLNRADPFAFICGIFAFICVESFLPAFLVCAPRQSGMRFGRITPAADGHLPSALKRRWRQQFGIFMPAVNKENGTAKHAEPTNGLAARTRGGPLIPRSPRKQYRYHLPAPATAVLAAHQAPVRERRSHSANPMRPRRASPNGTSERSSTRPPQYRASGSRTTSRLSPTAFR